MLLRSSLINQTVQRLRQGIVTIRGHTICRKHACSSLLARILRHLLHDARRVTNGSGARRHLFDNHGVRADLGAVADGETAQHLRTGADDHAAAQRRMTFGALIKRSTAQRHTLINRTVVADFRGLTDHHAESMVDEHTSADGRTRMNFDTREPSRQLGDKAPQPLQAAIPAAVRDAVQNDRVQARITGQDFPGVARCRIAFNDAGNIFSKLSKHNVAVNAECAILIVYRQVCRRWAGFPDVKNGITRGDIARRGSRRAAQYYLGRRCRRASYRQTPDATETFRLSTEPNMGMLTRISQVSRVRRRMPSPSEPMTNAVGPEKSPAYRSLSASSAMPISQTPRSLRSRMVRARLVTVMYGTVSAAPLATLAAVAFKPTARSFGTITACAPTPSATRRQAPRLCGSVMPSSISSSGGPSMASSNSSRLRASDNCEANAITPWWRRVPTILSRRAESTGMTRTLAALAAAIMSFMRPSTRLASTKISSTVAAS